MSQKEQNGLVELSNIIKAYESSSFQNMNLIAYLKHVGHLLEQDSIASHKKSKHSSSKHNSFTSKVQHISLILPNFEPELIQNVLEFTHEDSEFAIDLLLNHSKKELLEMIRDHQQLTNSSHEQSISPLFEMIELYHRKEMEELLSLEEEYFHLLSQCEEKRDMFLDSSAQFIPSTSTDDHLGAKIQFEKLLLQKRVQEESLRKNTKFYCKGEHQILQGKKQHIYSLQHSFEFDMSGEEIHFHIAASQFYRFLANRMYNNQRYRVVSVEYIVTPEFVSKFNEKKIALAKKHGFLVESMKPVLLFHGTSEVNMDNIVKTNFLISKVGSSTDMGFYGKGIYFSEFPGLSIGYSRGNPFLLVCVVLVGKAFKMANVQTGCALEKGYDSHTSPDGSEVVIFDTDCIIPMYKLKWAVY